MVHFEHSVWKNPHPMKIILEFLENSAKNYPEKVAFSDNKTDITYADLLDKAKAIGSNIANILNNQTRKPVIVVANRTIDSVIAFLGVIFSGNFYVPVDPKIPIERKRIIFERIKPSAFLSSRNNSDFLEGINDNQKQILLENSVNEVIDEHALLKIRQKMLDTDPLFAIFTSGSTGVPKSVLINHHSVIEFVETFSELFDLSNDVVLGNQAPLDYDGSVKEICLTLRNSSTMHIIPKMFFAFPKNLFEYLDDKKVNTINWATSALRIIAIHQALEYKKPSFINKIFFSGEVMPNKVLNYFRKHLPEVIFVNLYGPTETTFNCSYFIVDRDFSDLDDLPIGIPFPNTEIILLDQEDSPVNQGEIGEICVRGSSLALGYYNDPQATCKVFVQNPLNNHFPERIYRTGDLGHNNALGELMFDSRVDQQIKHMGYRIELGEIESAINALPFIEEAICVYDDTDEKIVLFYQAPEAIDKKILLNIKNRLPKHMIPTILIHQKKLPLKSNLKIDRVKLKKAYFNEVG